MTDTPTDKEQPEATPTNDFTLVEKANQAAERIEKANKESRELAERLEKAKAREILAGRSTITNEGPNLTPEQLKNKKAQEEADKIVKAFK